MLDDPTKPKSHPQIIETLQSLVFAFVLAMVFRGFVVEGFVIPTGSMAPTLRGMHLQKQSNQTGQQFAVGFDNARAISADRFSDPLLGRRHSLAANEAKRLDPKSGDRVLVLKSLYPFVEPERFDVVVFKNPTDTQGPSANYIKRLIGLPNETLFIADGDIFAKKGAGSFLIQRKPEHIQKSLWRPVSNSDAIPVDPLGLSRPWRGPPWRGNPQSAWTFQDRTWSCTTSEPSLLTWDTNDLHIDDWLPYNMLMPAVKQHPMSDIRVMATITPQNGQLVASFALESLRHEFEWLINGEEATLMMRKEDGSLVHSVTASMHTIEANQPLRMECWHVDQEMVLYLNHKRVASLQYDFGPEQRILLATGSLQSTPIEEAILQESTAPVLQWRFDGSPFTLTKVQVEHDLFYRGARLPSRATKNPTLEGNELLVQAGSPAYGTHPSKLAVLGEDQFMMAGDNSAYSLDGRLWGNPDEFVAAQIDDAPFLVHRDLLIGKAWSVYWPAPKKVFGSSRRTEFGLPIVPDFSQIRFIR